MLPPRQAFAIKLRTANRIEYKSQPIKKNVLAEEHALVSILIQFDSQF